jgi:ATP-binding cassette subfamily B multidrug efflux pump
VRGPARAVARYLARYRRRYGAGVLCLGAATLMSLGIPWTVKRAIEALEADAAHAPVAGYALVILALAVANGLARLGSRFSIIGGSQRIEYDIRNDLYTSLQSFPPAFYTHHPTGDLMARASSDVSAVKSLVGFGTISFVSTIFAFTGALSAMFLIDVRLTLWAMAPFPVLVVLARRFNATMTERTQAVQNQLGVVSAIVQEHLAGMAVVRAYTMEAHAGREFARANAEYLERSLALARVNARFSPLTGLISGLGMLIVLWLGGIAVAEGRLTLGALVAFNGYLAYLAWPTLALGWTLSLVRRGLTSMARIQEVSAGAPRPGGAAPAPGTPAIRFEHVTFAYDPERAPVLRDVSFEVGAGEMVAIVGHTGSGKSTLGLLLSRLWEPPPGTVFLGDVDVRTLAPGALRSAVGYVPQEAFLFSRSIADNVTLGRDHVSADRTRAAAGEAGIADEVEAFPEGWETVVGERGLTVSGGQRQRLALARALAGEPRVLVLDDVFASVDAIKEEEIVASLTCVRQGRTVLLMTHRLRAARAADRIVVLADGAVVETGTHAELLTAGGVYARLWRTQELEAEIARG